MAADLITLDEAKTQLSLTGLTEHDDLVQSDIDQATFLVLNRLKSRRSDAAAWAAVVDAWDDESLPLDVKAAILRMTTHLWAFRGGDDPKAAPDLSHGDLPDDVMLFLRRYVDPVVA